MMQDRPERVDRRGAPGQAKPEPQDWQKVFMRGMRPFYTMRDLARLFGYSENTVATATRGVYWVHYRRGRPLASDFPPYQEEYIHNG